MFGFFMFSAEMQRNKGNSFVTMVNGKYPIFLYEYLPVYIGNLPGKT